MYQFRRLMIAVVATLSMAQAFAAPTGAVATPTAKAPLIRYQFAPGELTKLCNDAIAATTSKVDALAKLAPANRTYDNTMLAYETATAELSDATTPLTFMGYVSTDAGIHQEGSDCEQNVGAYNAELSTRRDVYLAIKDMKPRNADETRLLSETVKGFERSGVQLPDDQRKQVADLQAQLAVLQSKFSTNLNNDTTTVELSAEALAGVPDSTLARFARSALGGILVTTKENDYSDVMSNATNTETRRKVMLAYYNRGGAVNVQLLEQAIQVRERIAAIMGMPTWADFRINGRMAKDAATVMTFLNGLKDKLADRNHQDLDKLLQYKKELDPKATQVDPWDISFLAYQLQKRDYSLDNEKIREYFPADVVISGLFQVYSRMLGVRFVLESEIPTWAPDVQVYRIENSADGRMIGYFYTDFAPRPGKYGHAAAFPLISARNLADGSYSQPISAIVANLTPPANGKPSLLTHDEVQTIFHEFGHIMHQTLTRAPYASLSGSNVAQDFVEAPSQMLENWVYSPEVLNLLSGHYLDHSRKLPASTLNQIIAARDFNQGYYYTRQLFLALLDMNYHTASGPVDTSAVSDRLYKQVLSLDPIAGGHFQASFGHLMGGYDAGYYGYLWSQVYAEDMFTVFQDKGLLSPEAGARYRQVILEKGSMEDAIDLLREFLGREPNSEAFFKMLHI